MNTRSSILHCIVLAICLFCIAESALCESNQEKHVCRETSADPVFSEFFGEYSSQVRQGRLCKKAPDLVAKVEDGTLSVASAAWWGFDPENSHSAIQIAINSSAAKIIVPNMGVPWNVSTTINLEKDDKKILVQRGVVVMASGPQFIRIDSLNLMEARERKNIILRGENGPTTTDQARFQMPRDAIIAAWRETNRRRANGEDLDARRVQNHCLLLLNCQGITISNLRFSEAGGDGIVLQGRSGRAECTNIVLENLVCQGNWRNGISICSARNCLISGCRITDSGGASPAAGIDFEPDQSNQRLENCEVRDSVIANNVSRALHINLEKLSPDSQPVSLRLGMLG